MVKLSNTINYPTPDFGEYKVRLLKDSEDTKTAKAQYTIVENGFALYYKKDRPTQNLLQWEIVEGAQAGNRISQFASDLDISGGYGLFAKACDLAKKTLSDPEALQYLVEHGITLVHHQEYSPDNDQIYKKWGLSKTSSSIDDNATLESYRKVLKAEAVANEKAKALLSDALSEEDI